MENFSSNTKQPKPVIKPVRKKIVVPPPRRVKMIRPTPRSSNTPDIALLDSLYEAIIIANSTGLIKAANTRAEALLGYPVSEFAGKTIPDLFPSLDPETLAGIWADIKNKRYTVMEAPCMRKNGTVMETETSVSGILWAKEDSVCFSIRDNTLHKEQESMLIAANDAIANIANGIVITNVDGLIEFTNPAFINMLGKSDQSEITGKDIREFFEETVGLEEMIGNLHDLFLCSQELVFKGAERSFPAHVNGSPNIDRNNKLSGMVFTIEDMTALNQAQEQKLESERVQARLDTIATLGYTINSPLQKLLSMAELEDRDDYRHEINTIAEIVAELHQNAPLKKAKAPEGMSRYDLKAAPGIVPVVAGKLLIAEDEEMISSLFVRVLKKAFPDLEVEVALDGEDAIEKFSKTHHSIVILDMIMPVLDGPAAYNRISELCETKGWETPHVIFCTGFMPTKEISNIVGDGSQHGFLKKPVTAAALTDLIKQFLSRKGGEKTASDKVN